MFKYVLIALLGLALAASAQSFLVPEGNFFAIPNVKTLSTSWALEVTDTSHLGLSFPTDFDLLKLSATDYRAVILEGDAPHFTTFHIDQQGGLPFSGLIRAGAAPSGCGDAVAMCLMQQGTYFDPDNDRLAVAFQTGATIGIYRFDRFNGEFIIDRTLTNPAITRPAGIYWAFNQFFVTDNEAKRIFRLTDQGALLSVYGRWGLFTNGYSTPSDISGYVDDKDLARFYVSDASLSRVDCFTATESDTGFHLVSQAWHVTADSLVSGFRQPACFPGVGVVSFDRFSKKFFFWSGNDSLGNSTRLVQTSLVQQATPIQIWSVGGRLVMALIDSASGGWTLASYTVSGTTLDNPTPYPTDHWTLSMSPVFIGNTWHVQTGTTLTIDSGVEVRFEKGAGLVVDQGGRLVVNGSGLGRVLFHAAHSGESWTGLKVSGGSISLSYSTVTDADSFCLFADQPELTGSVPLVLNHCDLDGSKLLYGSDALRILGKSERKMTVLNSRIHTTPKGRGLYLYDCIAEFIGDTIQGCDTSNAYLKQVTGTFASCVFEGRSQGHGVLFAGTGCTPNFQCCLFKNLASSNGAVPPLFALKGTGPTFGWEGLTTGVSNVISDSANTLLYFYNDKVMPIIDNVNSSGGPGGKNDWYQRKSGGYYLAWDGAVQPPRYPAQNQHWDHKLVSTDFSPSMSYFAVDTTRTNPWGLCGNGQGMMIGRDGTGQSIVRSGRSLDDLESDLALFNTAMTAELSENYSDAQRDFHTVASATADNRLRWQSLTHVITTQRHLDGASGDAWIPALLDSTLAMDSSAYTARVYGHRLLAAYHTDREQYNTAMTLCTDLLNSGLTFQDSLLVAIDLVGIQMLAPGEESGSGLDGARRPVIPTNLQVRSVAQGLMLEGDLLRQFGTRGHSEKPMSTLPTSYKLYQNYPNPFNPQTEIRFDLPEAVRVELKIYNSLGQLVTTLADQVRPAGSYTLLWDGTSSSGSVVASGLYIYQLRAGAFTDAKKMLLMR
ncbi:MAG TPA: FlgD immunoglobulin-like domain containing protein [bacterium]|jgi:hypothetical protein